MCYAIPGRVENIDGKYVIVDYFGEKRKAYNELEELNIGDYIYAQGGYVINLLSQQEAQNILNFWKETFFELQKEDLRLSKMDSQKNGVGKNTLKILDKSIEGRNLKYNELLDLINLNNNEELNLLYKTANFLRHKFHGNSCCVHGILEFSNYCFRNCYYCGISTNNVKIERYRLDENEIIEACKTAIDVYGFNSIVLQSGEDDYYSIELLCDIVKKIKKHKNVLIFLSIGEIGIDNLSKLYEAGARGLLLRFETSNEILYNKLHPGFSLQSRIEHLKSAYKMGYLIITGGLIGLPDQTNEDIINDILLTKELNAEMFSFGPFIPHPQTPLSTQKIVDKNFLLKVIALSRIIDPDNAKILVTTAFETIDTDAREKGLLAGANSVMLNLTPEKFRLFYDIYPNRAHSKDKLKLQIDDTIGLLKNLGRAPTDLGIRKNV